MTDAINTPDFAPVLNELDAGILSSGTQCRWQYAIAQADPAVWDELASGLLRDARAEPDHRIRDDILLLCLVACERANDVDPAIRSFNLDLNLEAA